MLDCKSREVLKVINQINKSQGYIGGSYDVLQYCSKRFTLSKIEIALDYLEKREYVNCIYFAKSINEIHLTHKGENYKEFAWIDFVEFLFRSILTPIAVAFITAIITTLVTLWLKSILHW